MIAQSGKDCSDPILLDTLSNQCSDKGAYDLGAQTSSGLAQPSCFPQDSGEKDIWFQFVPTFKNINIVVRGASRFGDSNTLIMPQMALYRGDCGNLDVVTCISDARGLNFTELTVGDLEQGTNYLIRVSSRSNHDGLFQLCINNFQFSPDHSSDCPDATILCDKETIKVDLVSGTGKIQDEADDTCLDTDPVTGSDDGNSESSSVWFKWIARTSGSLTFTLDPINPIDDLDFAVFELPRGINDCNNKVVLRCMASGENVGEPFSDWQRCTGATGLREGESHTDEQRGCQEGNTNFLAPLEMEEGKAYALIINNYSQSGSGFRLEWGGTGEFAGPEANIVFLDDKPIYCPDEEIRFFSEDVSISGQIDSYNWVYSGAINSGELNGAGPHSISFSSGGLKPIILNLTSNIGCITSLDTAVLIEEPIELTAVIDSISCHGYNDGSIEVNVTSPSTVTEQFWEDGPIDVAREGLAPGSYTFIVRNEKGCSASETFQLEQPLPITIDQILTNASCGGGMDGIIQLDVEGTFLPFEYDFMDGQGYTDSAYRENLGAGVYPISVRDQAGCEEDTVVLLSEIDIDIGRSILDQPSCYGFMDGSARIVADGGQSPYLYDFDTSGTFLSGNYFPSLSSGSYIVAIRDDANCTAFTSFFLAQPDSISLSIDTSHLACFRDQSGRIELSVSGGTPDYQIQWDHGPRGPILEDLNAGTYSVEIRDQNNCTSRQQLRLQEPPELTLSLENKMDLLCYGDSDGLIQIRAEGGEGSYIYSLNQKEMSVSPEFDGLTAGQYSLSVEDSNKCLDSINVQLTQPEELLVHITAASDTATIINLGESLILQGSYSPSDRIMSWNWTPADRVDCESCQQVTSMPLVNTSFILTGTDQDGCMAVDEYLVRVIPVRGIGVPNAVVPSESDQNGYVTVYAGPHVAQILEFTVFDRWGNQLFTRSNFSPNQFELGWDGTVQGKALIPGVYVYTTMVQYLDQVEKQFSGEILLIQ